MPSTRLTPSQSCKLCQLTLMCPYPTKVKPYRHGLFLDIAFPYLHLWHYGCHYIVKRVIQCVFANNRFYRSIHCQSNLDTEWLINVSPSKTKKTMVLTWKKKHEHFPPLQMNGASVMWGLFSHTLGCYNSQRPQLGWTYRNLRLFVIAGQLVNILNASKYKSDHKTSYSPYIVY